MVGLVNYGGFVVAMILFLMIPGPGNLTLITSTGKGGVRGGCAAVLGLVLGDQCLTWLALTGISAVLKAHPSAFSVVQWLGAAYLIWLGVRMLRARPGGSPLLQIQPRHYLRQALAITLLNPKAIVFYMAFLPLFIDPAQHPGWKAFGVLALTVGVLAFVYGLTVVLLTHFLAARMRANPVVGQVLRKVAGVFLVGFAIRLALVR